MYSDNAAASKTTNYGSEIGRWNEGIVLGGAKAFGRGPLWLGNLTSGER